MIKSVVVALVSLGLVILTTLALAPADAATSNSETYIWSFASLDNNQLVCKQVVMHPERSLQRRSSQEQVVQMSSISRIVSDRSCANSAKPDVAGG